MEAESPGIYDLTKLEDLFHCIDTLTKARVCLSSVDPDLAAELASITEALIGLSAAQSESGKRPRDFGEPSRDSGEQRQDVIVDVLSGVRAPSNPPENEQRQDVIVDVLTGEVIGARNKG